MERRYHLHNSPYLANNPYLNTFGSRYTTKHHGQLWGQPQPRPDPQISCTLPTILVLVLVILGVLAVAGLAIYMAGVLDEPKPFMAKEDFNFHRPLTTKVINKDQTHRAPLTTETPAPTTAETLPSQMIQGTYTVTSNEPKTKKSKDETPVVTPSLTITTKKVKATEAPDLLFGMRHSPALKQYLQPKETTTTAKTTTPTVSKTTYEEPWKPMVPSENRNFREKVDFEFGVGEAEVVTEPSLPRMKNAAIIEEVTKPDEIKTHIEKVTKPKVVFRSDLPEQKLMPEMSILQQFHDLDALLRSYEAPEKKPETQKPSAVVTLLPVRSNVGIRATLRPRPKAKDSTTTAETIPTEADQSKKIFINHQSDLVAIPLQKYFSTTNPTNLNATDKNVSYVTENLKGIAIVSTNNDDIASKRETRQSTGVNNRRPKMPGFPPKMDENSLKLDLEEIFSNLTTTARTVNSSKRTNVQKIDFNVHNTPSAIPFNLNTTQFLLNKLAKLQIASNESRNDAEKVSNKAVATSFSGNSPFRLLTKVYNKAPVKQEMTSEKTRIQTSGCMQNNTFLCGSGECLPNHLKCNKLMDCRDSSDEKNCTCADFLRNQYHTRKICDGIYDCWDYSDEQGCDWCAEGQHMCANSKMCIDPSQVCDGFPQCPYGDDEKNCITVAPSLEAANSKEYYPNGYLLVKKEGEWGKMCLQNFDNVISKSKSDWSLQDLGQSVCKTLSYKNFDGITRQKDVTPRSVSKAPVYYELAISDKNDSNRSDREKFAFQKTTCIEKEVAKVACSNLECGIRPEANIPWTNERRSRIVGGGNAGPGSWPWQAALYKEGEFQCGATLISETWLLSAGHCFFNAQNDYWVARLGALRRETPPAPYEQLRPISKIVLHPDYEDQGFINDISLLRMKEPIVLTSFVRPICLPQVFKEPRDGAMCTVVGWGQLYEIGRVFPDTLQEVQLPVISTGECRKRTIFLPLYKVTDNMFCAGYERGGRDACLGDSGGPLMCQESDGRWILTGVTSNGYGCARANRPGVYTKVVNYLPWVEQTILITEDDFLTPPVCHGHRCPLGECLPPARLCNGYIECRDSSDESGCW